jgi:hypothetical protein
MAGPESTFRPLHEFVPLLLDALVAPVQTRWRVRFDGTSCTQFRQFSIGG